MNGKEKILEVGAYTKLQLGDFVLWTKPWGEDKAVITATDPETIDLLLNLHIHHPDLFDTYVDDMLYAEDLENTFSVIVDPDIISLEIIPGDATLQIRTKIREAD